MGDATVCVGFGGFGCGHRSADVRPDLSGPLSLSYVILTSALCDTVTESHMSPIPEHERLVSKLRQWRARVEGHRLGIDESILSIAAEEPPVCEDNDSEFCDGRPE